MYIVVVCFSKMICQVFFVCFRVRMFKISDKADKFLLNYSNLFCGPLYIQMQLIITNDIL